MFPCEFYEISGYVTLLAVDHLLNVETQLTNSGVMEVQSWRHFLESFRALCRQNYHSTVSVVRSPSLALSVAWSAEQDHPCWAVLVGVDGLKYDLEQVIVYQDLSTNCSNCH